MAGRSEPFARHQDEENAQTGVDEEGDSQNHKSSFGKEFADVRLTDA